MNDLNDLEVPNDSPIDELEILKRQADQMGLKYSAKIGVDALRKKVHDYLNDEPSTPDEDEEDEVPVVAAAPVVQKSKLELEAERRAAMRAEQLKLVRLRITNMNPSKADLRGEIFTVANKVIGTVRKFIPFGEATDNGYHVPYILYRNLMERKFLSKRARKGSRGQDYIEERWVPEFSIEVLPPLTDKEISQLAASQAARGGLNDE